MLTKFMLKYFPLFWNKAVTWTTWYHIVSELNIVEQDLLQLFLIFMMKILGRNDTIDDDVRNENVI